MLFEIWFQTELHLHLGRQRVAGLHHCFASGNRTPSCLVLDLVTSVCLGCGNKTGCLNSRHLFLTALEPGGSNTKMPTRRVSLWAFSRLLYRAPLSHCVPLTSCGGGRRCSPVRSSWKALTLTCRHHLLNSSNPSYHQPLPSPITSALG